MLLLLLIQANSMLDLLHKPLTALPTPTRLPLTTMPAILIFMHIPLPTSPSMEIFVALAGAHGGLGDHILGGDAALGFEGGRVAGGGNHVARAAAPGAVFWVWGFAGDAFADDVGVDVGGGIFADVAGAWGRLVGGMR